MRSLWRVGGCLVATLILITDTSLFATDTTDGGGGIGGMAPIILTDRNSSLDCTTNICTAHNLIPFVRRDCRISATCVTSFVHNCRRTVRRTGAPGNATCVMNVRVTRVMGRHVLPKAHRRLGDAGSSVGTRLFDHNFITTLTGSAAVFARRGTNRFGGRTLTNTNRGCLTTGTGGPNIGILPDNLRCGMVGRNRNRVPRTSSRIRIVCRNHLVSKAMFSTASGRNNTTASGFHTNDLVGN